MSERFEKLLASALDRGVILGLIDDGRKFEILDPADDGTNEQERWWPALRLSEHDEQAFRAFIFNRLREAPYQALIGNSEILDEVFGLFTSTSELLNKSAKELGNENPYPSDRSHEQRAKWYRRNVFDQPLENAWTEDGMTIRDAALLDCPPALKVTDETIDEKVADVLARLMTGFLMATGEKSAPGGRRMLIPIVQFETLSLHAWRDDVIEDDHGLAYYACRVHSPYSLPSQFQGSAKRHATQWRNRMQIEAPAADPRLNWTIMDWITEFFPKYAKIHTSPQSIADAIHKQEFKPFFDQSKGIAKDLTLSSFRRVTRKYLKR